MFFKEDNDAQDVRFIIEEGEKSYVKDLSEFEEIVSEYLQKCDLVTNNNQNVPEEAGWKQ